MSSSNGSEALTNGQQPERRAPQPVTLSPAAWKWIGGIVATVTASLFVSIVVGVSTWFAGQVATTRDHGQRIAVLESQMVDVRQQLSKIEHRTESIDQKMDRVIERLPKP